MGRIRYWTCVLASLAAVFLSGCSATGPTYASMSGVMPALPENGCRVVFYRADSGLGIAVQPEIRLNSMVVGRSVSGGFFYVDTPPGRHLATSQTEVEARLELAAARRTHEMLAEAAGIGIWSYEPEGGRIELRYDSADTSVSVAYWFTPADVLETGITVLHTNPGNAPPRLNLRSSSGSPCEQRRGALCRRSDGAI